MSFSKRLVALGRRPCSGLAKHTGGSPRTLKVQGRLKHLNTQCVRQRDRILSGPELPHCCASLAGILTLLNADTFKQFKFQMPEEQAFGVLVEMMHAYSLRDLFRWQGMKLSKYSMRKIKKLTLRALRKKINLAAKHGCQPIC